MKPLALLAAAACCCSVAIAQQAPDPSFKPAVPRPAFAEGRGPVVAVDEAHHNFHTTTGRYQVFTELLRRDGFVVRASKKEFSRGSLDGVRVLVIANALHARNAANHWSLPTPSAFTADEITAVKAWVHDGGALLLIVDHMPFPGAAEALARGFGFTLSNGFAQDAAGKSALTFSRSNGGLREHAILAGRSNEEEITSVAAFTGMAFRCPPEATALFVLPSGSVSLEPETAWKFTPETKKIDVSGWAQAAVREFGRGRVALLGEAAMFSAQLSGKDKRPMGMNAPAAQQNPQFLLNVMHWLVRAIE